MTRIIRLSTPAMCVRCGKMIPAKRLAGWSMGNATCYGCLRKRGIAPEDPDEKAILDGMEDPE